MRAVVLVGLVACAAPASPSFNSGGPYIESGNHVGFGNGGFVDFGQSTLGLPSSFLVDGTELLQPSQPCAPGLVGLDLDPAVFVNAATPSENAQPFQVEWPGRVAVRVRDDYMVPYSGCGAGANTFAGSSTFVFYNNNRMVRIDDHVKPSTTPLTDAPACTCTGNSSFDAESFWAFTHGELFDATLAPQQRVNGDACILIGHTAVAVHYETTLNPNLVTVADAGGGTVAGQSLAPKAANWPADVEAHTESHVAFETAPTDSANMPLTDQDRCRIALAKLVYPTLRVNDVAVPVVEGRYQAIGQKYTGPVTISAPADMAEDFQIEIDFGGAKHVAVMLNGAVYDSYTVQAVDDHVLLELPPLTGNLFYVVEPVQ